MKNNDILYEKFPARIWAERFPLGNGNIGAMDDGGIERENISLNDDTLWSGNGSLKPLPESKHIACIKVPPIRAQTNAVAGNR